MGRATVIAGLLAGALLVPAPGSPAVPVAGSWSATPLAGNTQGHSLGFMMRVSGRRVTEVNMDYEGDVVFCTFRNVLSSNWLVGEHLRHLSRPIDGTGRFSVTMSGTALNQASLPGATVPYVLRITGRFVTRHAARGTITFSRGCRVSAPFAPWKAMG